ncbi:flagellar hook-length control protein FliK [Variovorax saccharolyticus]|uniref:flagellar hook-length control protein FliK n=1 Tax=Variovorax saccharolyticus TaxID=3053516 RepID=UPI002577005A|nr:flagellar hook-length control protein FliK [Variovorax sp. J22R187]MDM0021293.1 flagellar hook-length control protein FliK [Variovorax sp. J22R187]
MSGLTGLIDALLAVKASPRLDVLAIKGEAQIGAPGAAVPVLKVENDVRLPSKAALERVLPGGPSGLPAAAGAAGRQAPEAELSVAARVISAVLANLEADAAPVRGTAPAWPSRQPPSAPALASALSQTVAHSGLFYESHLVEFAAGTRSLAQLLEEPQARWATPLAAQRAAEPQAAAAPIPAAPGAEDTAVAATLAATLDVAEPMPDGDAPASLARSALPAAAAGSAAAVPVDGRAPPASDAAVPPAPEAARLQAAYGSADAVRPATAPDAPVSSRIEEAASAQHASAAAAKAATPPAEVIHPHAVNLVHQQLDLLATAVFRWNGEAWPGVAMNWSVEKEAADPSTDESVEDRPQRWSTSVSMSLPRLGEVNLRLSLAGSGVQARLAASDAGTAATLRSDSGSLVQRMEAAGLRLQDLQVAALEPAGDAP